MNEPSAQTSIYAALRATAEADPLRPCLFFEGEDFSYGRLNDDVLRWANALRAWGVNQGDRIALFMENCPDFVAAYLGVHLAGGIVVLINTQYRQVELRHILNDAGVILCITDEERREELVRVAADLVALEGVVISDCSDHPLESPEFLSRNVREQSAIDFLNVSLSWEFELPEPDSIAVIGYTSGTTGRSKGAMLRHSNLAANAHAVVKAWHWTADDRLLLTLPLFHAHGLFVGVNGTIVAGASAILRRRFEAADVFATLCGGEITMFFGVPTMYSRLIAEARKSDRRPAPLRLYVSGSAPLAVQTFEDFADLFGQRILERYGMTETIMNLTNPFEGERRPGTVGGPFPGQEARMVDLATRQPIDGEGVGEIQVRGPHVFPGYWENEEATAEAFDADGWFSTGDLGWRSGDGYYTISGRARELIISGGFNIYPREVEEVLMAHPAVADAAVLGMPDADFGEKVVAIVVPRGATLDPDDLIALCRDQLASFKKPRQVVFADSLPRNAMGKVQKHVLREWLESTASNPQTTPNW